MQSIDDILTDIGIGRFNVLLLFAMGIIHSCDAMEMMILVFLGPFLTCSWKITALESSLLTAAVIFGIMIGAVVLGKFSDIYGRKLVLLISNLGLLYFGILCVLSTTIYWLMVLRFLVGIWIGGNSATQYALMSEMTPIKYRGSFLISFQFFWALGSYLIATLSFLVYPVYGWRIVLLCAIIPVVIIIFVIIWIPESPRYLLLQGKKTECLDVINKIARMNKYKQIRDVNETSFAKSSFRDLFHPNYLSSTIMLNVMLFVLGITYCSILLMLTYIDNVPHRCLQNLWTYSKTSLISNFTDDSCCSSVTWEAYKNIYISTTGELFVLPLSILLINVVGRKITIGFNSLIISVCLFLLNLCLKPLQLNILLFVLRGSLVSFASVSAIYATEIFPTSVRSLGLGLCGCSTRTGAILSTFVVNILILRYSFIGGTLLLFSFNVIALIVCFFLPIETKNRRLFQTADDNGSSEPLQK